MDIKILVVDRHKNVSELKVGDKVSPSLFLIYRSSSTQFKINKHVFRNTNYYILQNCRLSR
jgi:hypothetical protein